MWIVPKEGYQLVEPNSGAIVPPEGMEVRDGDLYWVRRLRDGDCTKGEAPGSAEADGGEPEREREGA